MKEKFGAKIYGRYGFADAFQPQTGWVNPDVLGIGVGITLLSAENLRTGAVWRWFMSIREIYDRLSPSWRGQGGAPFREGVVYLVLIVGALFLLIQFVALVVGLALARSITGSVHELFVGTVRVQHGDFSHRIEVKARDQLGELADSFNTMTGRLTQLLAEMAEKKRLEEELRIARNIQMSLLPQGQVRMPGLIMCSVSRCGEAPDPVSR